MRFLVDENCEFSLVQTLRSAGHDVVAVAEVSPRAEDSQVIERALRQKRILVTEDKDFGQLVFAAGKGSVGVLLIRYPGATRKSIGIEIVRFIEIDGSKLDGNFVVATPGRIRVSRLPGSQ